MGVYIYIHIYPTYQLLDRYPIYIINIYIYLLLYIMGDILIYYIHTMFGFPIAGMDDQKLINQGPGQRRRADRNERRGAQPELATAEPLGRHDAIVSY